MNKYFWSILIFITSILFIVSFFTSDISYAVIALILAFILDKNKPFKDKNKKKKEFLEGIKKERNFENEG